MRMDWDGTDGLREVDEGDFGRLCGIKKSKLCFRSNMRRLRGGERQEAPEGKVGCTYWVIRAESEAEAVCLIQVERIGV